VRSNCIYYIYFYLCVSGVSYFDDDDEPWSGGGRGGASHRD
jgi:hypothetical protein